MSPLLLLLVATTCCLGEQLIFQNSEFTCTRPTTFVKHATSVAEIEKPLFYTCRVGETRDRTVDLELAKAYLDEDNTSLSCETIQWLNSRTGNAHCMRVAHAKLKKKFFKWFLTEATESLTECSDAHFLTKLKDTVACFLAGAVKDKCTHHSDTPLLSGFGCCDLEQDDIRSNTIFYRARGSKEVVQDLEELERFVQFKVNEIALKCPVTKASTATEEPKVIEKIGKSIKAKISKEKPVTISTKPTKGAPLKSHLH